MVLFLKIRYKQPDIEKNIQLEEMIKETHTALEKTLEDFRFLVDVAEFFCY